jgi:hypothetical protein
MPIGLPKRVYRFRDFGKSLFKGVEPTDGGTREGYIYICAARYRMMTTFTASCYQIITTDRTVLIQVGARLVE